MSDLSVKTNAAGTMAASFSIGKRGPTIRQGDTDPNTPIILDGVPGDLYVRRGASPKLYQRYSGTWIDLTNNSIDRTTTGASSYTIGSDETYLGIRGSGNVTVTLPAGKINRKLIIKDEVGRSPENTIMILAAGQDTIDGQAAFILNNRDSITVFFGAEWHII